MIEFITVSHQPWRIPPLERSLGAALGPADRWRLTVVDGTRHDIFGGYNAGAASVSGDVLAFLHHDVQLLGNALTFERPLHLLGNPATGFIGIAGATRLNEAGCWWGDLPLAETLTHCRGMVAYPQDNALGVKYQVWPGGEAHFGRVLVVDGVLMMCHRRSFERLGGFDAKTFRGFHFYDVDISFRAHLAGLANYVAPLPLLHESTGDYTAAWHAAREVFVRKFAGSLPCRLDGGAAA